MLKFTLSPSTLNFITKTFSLFSKRKRDSRWIYSSKSEEMTHARPGLIKLSLLPPQPFDATLRLHRAIQSAHLILTSNQVAVQNFLKKMGQKQVQEETNDSNVQLYQNQEANLVKFKEETSESIAPTLELSKQLQIALQTQKINQSNNDRENRHLKQRQEELINFMEITKLKDQFQGFKNANSGWPKVQNLSKHLPQMKAWRKGGIEVLCLLQEFNPFQTKKLIKYLQNQKLPYEILPAPNCIINTLAASGFPADRFSLEYFPEHFDLLFLERASMKMTLGIILKSQDVAKCFENIIKHYGDPHMVYLQNSEGVMIGRGEVAELIDSVKQLQSGSICRMAVAPYLSTFNSSLKEENNKISRLQGQGYHQHTHFVRIQFISQEISRLQQAKDPRHFQLYNFLQIMLRNGIPEQSIYKMASELTGASEDHIKQLTDEVKQGMTADYLGMKEMSHKK